MASLACSSHVSGTSPWCVPLALPHSSAQLPFKALCRRELDGSLKLDVPIHEPLDLLDEEVASMDRNWELLPGERVLQEGKGRATVLQRYLISRLQLLAALHAAGRRRVAFVWPVGHLRLPESMP